MATTRKVIGRPRKYASVKIRQRAYAREHPAIVLRMKPGDRELIKQAAEARGTTMNRWAGTVLVKMAQAVVCGIGYGVTP